MKLENNSALDTVSYARAITSFSFTSEQQGVIDTIISKSKAAGLNKCDIATLLATGWVESKFNPQAKAQSTSASGVFQIVKRTALGLGLPWSKVMDKESNIDAGIKLFKQSMNSSYIKNAGRNTEERALRLYELHHDGPSRKYGGYEIAQKRIAPVLSQFQSMVDKL